MFGESLRSIVDPGPGSEWQVNAHLEQSFQNDTIDPALLSTSCSAPYEPLSSDYTGELPILDGDASLHPTSSPAYPSEVTFPRSLFSSLVSTTSSSPSSGFIHDKLQPSPLDSTPSRHSAMSVLPSITTSLDNAAGAVALPLPPSRHTDQPHPVGCPFRSCSKSFLSEPPLARGSLE